MGTANVFSNRRYTNGASTNPDFNVVQIASVQVKNAIDATIARWYRLCILGRKRRFHEFVEYKHKNELDHLERFLVWLVTIRKQGFKGTFFIEPKPMEPTKHQYDFDTQTVLGFLNKYGLIDDFKMNVEVNHATLAGHTFAHELRMAADAGKLGSIDANKGDNQNGWDTDEFPSNITEITEAMLEIIPAGGFTDGGINLMLRHAETQLTLKISSLLISAVWTYLHVL